MNKLSAQQLPTAFFILYSARTVYVTQESGNERSARQARVGGRLQLPVEMRRALSLGDGDTVLLEMVSGEIHVRPLRDAVSRVQARLRGYVPADVSLSRELIADRCAQAASE